VCKYKNFFVTLHPKKKKNAQKAKKIDIFLGITHLNNKEK